MNSRLHGPECLSLKPCHSCYQKAWYLKKLKPQRKLKMKNPEYREDYLSKLKERNSKIYSDPVKREKQRQATKRWVESNKSQFKTYASQWCRDNADKCRFKVAQRKAAKLKAMPAWASTKELQKVYQECPSGMEVDHIVPLQGKTVCGLHVPWNLQYLSPFENRSKGNSLKEQIWQILI